MKQMLQDLRDASLKAILDCEDAELLESLRVKYLGKKGELTEVLKSMKDVSPEDRPKVGQLVNDTRAEIEKVLEETKAKIASLAYIQNELNGIPNLV